MSSQQPSNVPPTWPQAPATPKSWYQQPRIIIPTIAGVLIACCAGLYILGVNSPSSTSSSSAAATHPPTATSQPTRTSQPSPSPTLTATAAPTATTAPTATLGPTATVGPQAIENQAILGGLATYFNQTYPLQSATFNGVAATFTGSSDKGTDGQQHIVDLEFTVPSAPSVSQMSNFLQHFMPSDAHATRTISVQGNPEYDYLSQDLAHTFPASTFLTDASGIAPAGTFSWFCLSATQCTLALGGG